MRTLLISAKVSSRWESCPTVTVVRPTVTVEAASLQRVDPDYQKYSAAYYQILQPV